MNVLPINLRQRPSSCFLFLLSTVPLFRRLPSFTLAAIIHLVASFLLASLSLIFHLISAWLALLSLHIAHSLSALLPLYNSPCCFSLSLLCHSPARSLIDSGGDVTGMPSGSSLFCRRAAGVRVERRFTSISLSLSVNVRIVWREDDGDDEDDENQSRPPLRPSETSL